MARLVSQTTLFQAFSCDFTKAKPTQNASELEVTSITKKADLVSMSFTRRLYQNKDFSQQATNVFLNSWREFNTEHILVSGYNSVPKGRLIPLVHL